MILLGIAALVALWSPLAGAQTRTDTGLYTVRAVPVRAEAASVVAAKEQALIQGQTEALRILLERLTLPEDHGRLPTPSMDTLQNMVLGLSIDDERTPPRGYIATLTVTFIPQVVQALLQQADIPFSDQRGRSLVVVPVWQGGPEQAPVLWEDPNPWREAWANRRRQGLVPLETPLGDLDDVATIDVTRALAIDSTALSGLAERYGAAGTVVAAARLEPGTNGAPAQVRVDVTKSGVGGAASGGVETTRFAVTQALATDTPPQSALPQALTEAIRSVARELDATWKVRAVGFSGATVQMTALVPLDGRLDNWLEVRRRLDASPAVRETRLQAMTKDRAQITVLYGGPPDELAESLRRQGLSLTDNDGYWTLRPTSDSAPMLQAPALQAPVLQAPTSQAPDMVQPSGTILVR
ncbi:MAG: hypothetical protein VR70_08515 [Rhodospirillaceae bacterium BRH_c57]|nr:MAG: hypothetical protein VR70_08515 [Rhodospirillaceae bacterium BRH_c57]